MSEYISCKKQCIWGCENVNNPKQNFISTKNLFKLLFLILQGYGVYSSEDNVYQF